FVAERLMRRWIAEGTPATQDAAAKLLESAANPSDRLRLIAAWEQGFHDRPSAAPAFGSGGLFAHSEAAEVNLAKSRHSKYETLSPRLMAQFNRWWEVETTNV